MKLTKTQMSVILCKYITYFIYGIIALSIDIICGEGPVLQWKYELQPHSANQTSHIRLPMIDESYKSGNSALGECLYFIPRALYKVILEYAIEDDVVPSLSVERAKRVLKIYPSLSPIFDNTFMMAVASSKIAGRRELYSCNIQDGTITQLFEPHYFLHCKNINQQNDKHRLVISNNYKNKTFFDIESDCYVNLNSSSYLELCSRTAGTYAQLLNSNKRYQALHYAGFYVHNGQSCVAIVASREDLASTTPNKIVILRYSFCRDTLSSDLINESQLIGTFYEGAVDAQGNFIYAVQQESDTKESAYFYQLCGSTSFFNTNLLPHIQSIINGFLHCQKISRSTQANPGLWPTLKSSTFIMYTGGDKLLSWKFSTDPESITTRSQLKPQPTARKATHPSIKLRLARKRKQLLVKAMKFFTLGSFLYCCSYQNHTIGSAVKSLGIISISSLALGSCLKVIFNPKTVKCSL